MQRWRRGRSAGEGTRPDVAETDPPVDSAPDARKNLGRDDGEADTVPAEASTEAPAATRTLTVDAAQDEDATPVEDAARGEDVPETAGAAAPVATTDADDTSGSTADAPDTTDENDTAEEDLGTEPEADPEADPEVEPAQPSPATSGPRRTGFVAWIARGTPPRDWIVVTLLQAAHAKQAIVTALAMGAAAIATGRPAREVGVIVLTVLVGQTILGWHNDITDKARDHRHRTPRKPVADGRLEVGTVWYAIVVATLILVPLSITTGITAGCIYLASVAVGMLGNVVLRTGVLSFWSWALSYAMLPAYLSYGGWGGQALGTAPQTSIVVLAALLGIGVHFLRSVWGLVADHEDGWTYLPLKLGLKLGATRLLALSTLYTVVIAVLLVVFGVRDGLSR